MWLPIECQSTLGFLCSITLLVLEFFFLIAMSQAGLRYKIRIGSQLMW